MKAIVRVVSGILLATFLMAFVVFANPGVASAHTVNQVVSKQHTTHVVIRQLSPNVQVKPNSFQCYIKNINSKLGHICVTIYLQCVGPVCVPYAADISFDQNALDGLVTAGSSAAGIIASVLVGFPAAGTVAAIVAGALSAIDYLAKVVCGGNGAGVYIGYPALIPSPHC